MTAPLAWSTFFDHSGNAGFQAWYNEVIAKWDACAGVARTGDTGQIGAAVARPGTGTAGGYVMYYLNDSIHGTWPVYIKLEFGTGSSANFPAIWVTVGTGTNGSGTLTGVVSTRQQITRNVAPTSLVTNYQSYLCADATNGFVGMCHKIGSGATSATFMAVARFTDNSSALISGGVCFYYTDTSGVVLRATLTSAEALDLGNYAFFIGPNNSSTLVGGAPQVARHFTKQPTGTVQPQLVSFQFGEQGDQSTFPFSAAGTSLTYIAFNGTTSSAGAPLQASAQANNAHKIAMLYQ